MRDRVSSSWNDFTFPESVMNPSSVTVFAAPGVSGSWSAIYMIRALQETYGDIPVHLVIRRDLADLAGFLPWKPEMHVFDGNPSVTDPPVPEGTLLFSTEPDDALIRFVEGSRPSACVSTEDHPAVNIQVRVEEKLLPGRIQVMMGVLGMQGYGNWVPEAPPVMAEKASAILSPVSHRTLPYILSTEAAASILEKKRAEIPLKLVITDGKSSNIPPDTDQPLIGAIVAGASAVVTTDPELWVHSTALGIPVIGLDRKGIFSGWDDEPSTGETQFLEKWADLIRKGW